MNFDVLTKQLHYWAILLVTSCGMGVLVSTVVLSREAGKILLKTADYRSLIKFMIVTVLVGVLNTIFMRLNNVSKDVLTGLTLVISITLALRFVRMYKASQISKNKLHFLTLSDLLIFGSSMTFLKLWIYILLLGKGYFSTINVFGIPAFYVLLCWYIIFNCNLICPERVKLAKWRLVTYAFPGGNEHRKGRIGKHEYYGPRIIDLLGWSLFLLIISASLLFGYWVTGYPIAVALYFATVLATMVVIILSKGGWKPAVKNKVYVCILGGGLVIACACVLMLLSNWKPLYHPDTIDRGLSAMVICMPFMLLAVQFVPQMPNKLWNHGKAYLKKSQTYEAIRAVSDSAQVSMFASRRLSIFQALLVSAVFLFYFIVPQIEPVLCSVGLTEINGKSIHELLAEFQKIASTWSIPEKWTGEQFVSFIFGNQGLVLLFLAWSGITFMVWAEAPSCLEKVPHLFESKLAKVFSSIHIALFYICFLPFLFAVTLLIPCIGLSLMGYSFAILLGVFAFGLFLPKLQAILLSLGYLLLAITNTNMARDAVNINTAPAKELTLVPGLGSKLAKRIINGRPYNTVDDLIRVEGFGCDKLDAIRELIRI